LYESFKETEATLVKKLKDFASEKLSTVAPRLTGSWLLSAAPQRIRLRYEFVRGRNGDAKLVGCRSREVQGFLGTGGSRGGLGG
jgi:hypothetical protein